MADPPPPSYDDAITGTYSAPTPPLSPPPPVFSPLPPPVIPTPPFLPPLPQSEYFSEIPNHQLNGEEETRPLDNGEHYERRANNIK